MAGYLLARILFGRFIQAAGIDDAKQVQHDYPDQLVGLRFKFFVKNKNFSRVDDPHQQASPVQLLLQPGDRKRFGDIKRNQGPQNNQNGITDVTLQWIKFHGDFS